MPPLCFLDRPSVPRTREVSWLGPGGVSVKGHAQGGGVRGDCRSAELFPQVCLDQLTSGSAPTSGPRVAPSWCGEVRRQVLPAPAALQLPTAETPGGPGRHGTLGWCLLTPSHTGLCPCSPLRPEQWGKDHAERAQQVQPVSPLHGALSRWRRLTDLCSRRVRGHAWLPLSGGPTEGPLREASGHVGLR